MVISLLDFFMINFQENNFPTWKKDYFGFLEVQSLQKKGKKNTDSNLIELKLNVLIRYKNKTVWWW